MIKIIGCGLIAFALELLLLCVLTEGSGSKVGIISMVFFWGLAFITGVFK